MFDGLHPFPSRSRSFASPPHSLTPVPTPGPAAISAVMASFGLASPTSSVLAVPLSPQTRPLASSGCLKAQCLQDSCPSSCSYCRGCDSASPPPATFKDVLLLGATSAMALQVPGLNSCQVTSVVSSQVVPCPMQPRRFLRLDSQRIAASEREHDMDG